jgi:hypothetical protein
LVRDLYIIVHEEAARENSLAWRELRRIRREERFVLIEGNPCVVQYTIPKLGQLRVCGAYAGRLQGDHRCVDEHVKALRRALRSTGGIERVHYHTKGIVFLDP